MFGYEYEIVREYPHYFLDYREKLDDDTRWSDRFVSSSGDWSGNIYDFYFRVYNRIAQSIKVPFALDGISRIDDTELHKALREALANTLINADYYGNTGVVIERNLTSITMTNAGTFRIDLDEAINGGISDPRNSGLIKMFSLINIGERAGSGLPMIFKAWTGTDFAMPDITEKENPDRVCLILPVESLGEVGLTSTQCPNKKANEGSDVLINESKSAGCPNKSANEGSKVMIDDSTDSEINKQKQLLNILEKNPHITQHVMALELNTTDRTIRRILASLQKSGIVKRKGSKKNGYWLILK